MSPFVLKAQTRGRNYGHVDRQGVAEKAQKERSCHANNNDLSRIALHQRDACDWDHSSDLWQLPQVDATDVLLNSPCGSSFGLVCATIERCWQVSPAECLPASLRKTTPYSMAVLVRIADCALRTNKNIARGHQVLMTAYSERRTAEKGQACVSVNDERDTELIMKGILDFVTTATKTIRGQKDPDLVEEQITESRAGLMLVDLWEARSFLQDEKQMRTFNGSSVEEAKRMKLARRQAKRTTTRGRRKAEREADRACSTRHQTKHQQQMIGEDDRRLRQYLESSAAGVNGAGELPSHMDLDSETAMLAKAGEEVEGRAEQVKSPDSELARLGHLVKGPNCQDERTKGPRVINSRWRSKMRHMQRGGMQSLSSTRLQINSMPSLHAKVEGAEQLTAKMDSLGLSQQRALPVADFRALAAGYIRSESSERRKHSAMETAPKIPGPTGVSGRCDPVGHFRRF